MIKAHWQIKFSKTLSSRLTRRAGLHEHSGENKLRSNLETEWKSEFCFLKMLVRHAVENRKGGKCKC